MATDMTMAVPMAVTVVTAAPHYNLWYVAVSFDVDGMGRLTHLWMVRQDKAQDGRPEVWTTVSPTGVTMNTDTESRWHRRVIGAIFELPWTPFDEQGNKVTW